MPRHSLHVLLSSTLALGLVCGCGSSQRRSEYSGGSYPGVIVPPSPMPAAPADDSQEQVRNGYHGSGLPGDTSPTVDYNGNPFETTNPPALNHNPFETPLTGDQPQTWPRPDGDQEPLTTPPVGAPRPPLVAEVTPEQALKDLGATVERDAAGRVVLVDLSGSRAVNDDLALLRELAELRQLDLSSTGITDVGVKHIANLPELQLLALSGTGVSDAGIAQLKALRLRFLLLGFTTVSDASVETLAGMTQLEGLSLRGTKITSDGIARLKQRLPKCRIVADPPQASSQSTRPGPSTPGDGQSRPADLPAPTYPVDSPAPERSKGPSLKNAPKRQTLLPGMPAGTALRPAGPILSEAEQQLIRMAIGNLADPQTFDAVGEYYAATGRPNAAIPWLASAVEAAPDRRIYRYHLGLALARVGRTDAALGHFEAAVGRPAAHYNLGVVTYETGDLATSQRHFSEALRQNPDLEPARVWLDRVDGELAARTAESATRDAMTR